MNDSFFSKVREFSGIYDNKPEAITDNYSLFVARVDEVLFLATSGNYKNFIYKINKDGITDELHVLMNDFYKLIQGDKSNGFCSYLTILSEENDYNSDYSRKNLLLIEDVDFKIGTYNLIRECSSELLVKFIKLLYTHF